MARFTYPIGCVAWNYKSCLWANSSLRTFHSIKLRVYERQESFFPLKIQRFQRFYSGSTNGKTIMSNESALLPEFADAKNVQKKAKKIDKNFIFCCFAEFFFHSFLLRCDSLSAQRFSWSVFFKLNVTHSKDPNTYALCICIICIMRSDIHTYVYVYVYVGMYMWNFL
jgi:hypothetical protein